tara:strand:- start:996 stop:2720 length:1725 start_codon:yes stop_codon:yes gene_type:complete
MNNTYIELREKDSQTKYQPGFYKSVLNEKTKISNNDTIVISKSFIDTESVNQQNINIKETLKLNLGVCLYGTKITRDAAMAVPDGYIDDYSALDFNANKNYVACSQVIIADDPNMRFFKNISYTYLSSARADFTAFGNLDITIEYTNVSKQLESVMVHIPMREKSFKSGASNTYIIDNLNITYDSDPQYLQPQVSTSQSTLDKKNVKITLGPSQPCGEYHWTPIVFDGQYTLEQGSYTPQALCSEINRQLQFNPMNKAIDDQSVNSQFFIDSANVLSPLTFIETTTDKFNDYPYNANGFATMYNQTAGYHSWLGASQMELAYDVDNDKFFWSYIHTPYFDADGGEAIRYAGDSSNPAGSQTFINNKIGGVVFNYMNAENEDGNYVDFWGQQMGFDLDNLLTTWTLQPFVSSTTGETSLGPLLRVQDGFNTTGNFVNIGSAVNAKAGSFWEVPDYNTTPLLSTSFNTFKINAVEKAVNITYNFPYFLIELKAGFLNNVYDTTTNHREIASIVGKYYTLNSFTFGSVSDSIAYTHKGEDLYLSDFQVRILNPDKSIAEGIGDNSCIVLQIIKAEVN